MAKIGAKGSGLPRRAAALLAMTRKGETAEQRLSLRACEAGVAIRTPVQKAKQSNAASAIISAA